MSYSNINDAFNINSNFEKIIQGLNTYNTNDNTIENVRSSCNETPTIESNYFQNKKIKGCSTINNTDFYNPNDVKAYTLSSQMSSYDNPNNPSPIVAPIIDNMFASDDNSSWESLNGTDLYSHNDHDEKVKNSKLTHRQCIDIYNSPESYKDNILSHALKHVSKCNTCKEEIKNSLAEIKKIEKKSILKNNSNINNKKINAIQNSNSNIIPNNILDSKIESELKLLNEKINGESNIKYQNALIQNNISKYFEELEEKKKINSKLDKIMDFINKNETYYGTNNIQNNQDTNLFNLLSSPQIINSLTKLTNLIKTTDTTIQQPSPPPPPSSSSFSDHYIYYIAIVIIITLLIIDIILRFNDKNQ